jgi:C4-dicarboxylate-specific signal transduction histidine kinase
MGTIPAVARVNGETGMKIHIILIVLSLLAFLSALTGGYLYYSSVKVAAFKESDKQAALQAETIKNHISLLLSENLRSVRALAGLKELKKAISTKDEASLSEANFTLDHFNEALGVDVCYLMDRNGDTLASSNRNAPDSFVGENYAFRPYFKQAIEGHPAIYMALGITSKKRGVYYSHPVYGEKLKLAKDELTRYTKDLEAKVKERTKEITSILENTPAIVFIKNVELRDLRHIKIRGRR